MQKSYLLSRDTGIEYLGSFMLSLRYNYHIHSLTLFEQGPRKDVWQGALHDRYDLLHSIPDHVLGGIINRSIVNICFQVIVMSNPAIPIMEVLETTDIPVAVIFQFLFLAQPNSG